MLFTSSYAISYHISQHAHGNPTPVMANKESEQNTDSERELLPTNSRVRVENFTLGWDGVQSEKLLQLKRSRSSKKGILTKAQKEIKGFMLNSNNDIQSTRQRIKSSRDVGELVLNPIQLIRS